MPAQYSPDEERNHARSIEEKLHALRDSHRLAVHIWEENEFPNFPGFSWKHINAVPAYSIAGKLARREDIPLLSMSLLPSAMSGKSMRPWGIDESGNPACGYLLDMSQEQAHPPRVLNASVGNLYSGEDPYRKELHLNIRFNPPVLNNFYQQFSSVDELKTRMGTEDGKNLTAFQLDGLGAYYEGNGFNSMMEYLEMPGVLYNNEIIAAVGKEHIQAIVVPYYAPVTAQSYFRPVSRLTAALAGLQHLLQHGLDVPVVYYGVTGGCDGLGEPIMAGDCRYLAQGYRELAELALQAIGDLQKNDMKAYTACRQHNPQLLAKCKVTTQKMLGIDIETSLAEQRTVVELLRKEGPAGQFAGKA